MDNDQTKILQATTAEEHLKELARVNAEYNKKLSSVPIEEQIKQVVSNFYDRLFGAYRRGGISGTDEQPPLDQEAEELLQMMRKNREEATYEDLINKFRKGKRTFESVDLPGAPEEVTKLVQAEMTAGRIPPPRPPASTKLKVPPKPQALLDLKPMVDPNIKKLAEASVGTGSNLARAAQLGLTGLAAGTIPYDIATGEPVSGAITLAQLLSKSIPGAAVLELLRPTSTATEEEEFKDPRWEKLKDSMIKKPVP